MAKTASTSVQEPVVLDFSKYKGKYVALVKKRVVASGTNARTTWNRAKQKAPRDTPTLVKVPKDETLVLIVCA
ncbi:MAG TPA: DUF5678 domain-containing protein [Candidatus Bathyarchaeia archaeon]|nr:DUF5678 domain-containing protein [Candidatus Bathyarchaeia archaeon]